MVDAGVVALHIAAKDELVRRQPGADVAHGGFGSPLLLASLARHVVAAFGEIERGLLQRRRKELPKADRRFRENPPGRTEVKERRRQGRSGWIAAPSEGTAPVSGGHDGAQPFRSRFSRSSRPQP
jgi:hypothetical protein